MVSMIQVLKTAVRENASDIHITAGVPPALRVKGEILFLNVEPLTGQQSKDMCYSILTDEQKGAFEVSMDLDFGFSIDESARFRGHLYYQKRMIAGSFRQIPMEIPTLLDIGLPPVLSELSKKPYGLILVTGPTGSGKTTTLASMLNEINQNKKGHILTIEDPVEFVYSHERCIVHQREIGFDTPNFHSALKAALRVDPDICLLGELRDKETISTALHIAETGHLTFGTLHTNNTAQTMDRLTGVFDKEERLMVQSQLSQVLQGVVSQRLIPTVSGNSRIPAVEVLLFPAAIRNLVREGKSNQIYSVMQTQKASGMMTLNQSLAELVHKSLISESTALSNSYDPNELIQLIRRKPYGKSA